MKAERWQRVETLFQAALARAPETRTTFLVEACPDNPSLREEVEKLLASFDAADSFLETPAADDLGFISQSSAVPSLASGQQLAHYEILSLLGVGGMGEVYLARDTKLDRPIALKLLPAQFAADPERVRRFEREARAASALNHPNIITIHEIGQESGTHFIATEYIAGETLRQRLNHGKLATSEAVAIARQIASALSAAHQAGIVHRDIKPENVMIWPDGLVKVLDFGLAKPLGEEPEPPSNTRLSETPLQTDPDLLVGTLNYLSPEQVRREKLDARTDLFSLGVVLYEMLAGARPFTGSTAAEVCAAILHGIPPPLVTCPLSHIVNRALAKERARRYQTAAELQADLSASALAQPAMSRSRRRLVMAVMLILVLCALGFWTWAKRGAKTEPAFKAQLAQKLTDLAGQELFPILAPDGQSFVFASYGSGNWDIYRQTIGAREAVNLTADSRGLDFQPAFSPDGARIAFCSTRHGSGVFVMNSDGGQVERLTEGGNNPAWSPDGREIAFADERIWDYEARTTYPSRSHLWAVNLATRTRRLITEHDAVQPSWSPHGHRLAFWGEQKGGHRDIWTVAASGGSEPVTVTDDGYVDWNPVWSPDGRQLYFLSNRRGGMNLWRVAIDEASGRVLGAPEPALLPTDNAQHINFARDGRSLIYAQINRSENLWQIAFDPASGKVTGTATPLIQGLKRYTMFSLAPDEQSFVYLAQGEPQYDLFVSKLDGTPLRRLTDDIAQDQVPRWSPDGQRIAFLSDRSGKYEIWQVRQDGIGLAQMTNVPGQEVIDPVWSPDGKRLLYQIRNVNSFIIHADQPGAAQTPQPLTGQAPPGFLVWDWSPNGELLGGWQPGQEKPHRGIVVYSFARQSYERLTDFGEFPVWLNDNQRLLFLNSRELYLLDRMGGQPRQIFSLSTNDFGLLALSRDNRRIYFTRRSNEADIWLLRLE